MMSKQRELAKIADEIRTCPLCRKGGTGKPVPGEGSGEFPLLFVGEAPGRTEAETGRPFMGRSGKFLRQMIGEIGLDEAKIFITSPLHYFPLCGKPSPASVEHGARHLRKQVGIIRPRMIVLLGNTACRALLGENTEIAKMHGTLVLKDDIHYFISYHPAYAVRFPEGRKKFIQDFCSLKGLLQKFLPGTPGLRYTAPHFS